MSENKRSLALSVINSDYIPLYSETTWGYSILIMEKNGLSFGRVSWYKDNYDAVYLDSLNVDEKARRNGLGTKMQEIREAIGRALGSSDAMLSVVKESYVPLV